MMKKLGFAVAAASLVMLAGCESPATNEAGNDMSNDMIANDMGDDMMSNDMMANDMGDDMSNDMMMNDTDNGMVDPLADPMADNSVDPAAQ